jgi:hypothetical protein
MRNRLGTVRQNRWFAGIFAAAIVIWAVRNVLQFHRSTTVDATLEATDKQSVVPMFGAEFVPGNIVEVTVAKSDLGHLQGFITFCGYAQPIAVMVVLLFGLLFLYRFVVDVLTGRPFTTRANSNLLMVGVAVVAYPIVPGIFGRLGTNSVIGALDLHDFNSASSVVGIWTALGIAFFLQIVFAAMQQGAKLAEDTEGLV